MNFMALVCRLKMGKNVQLQSFWNGWICKRAKMAHSVLVPSVAYQLENIHVSMFFGDEIIHMEVRTENEL